MKKFAIDLNNLKDKVFYECILRGSKLAVKHKFKEYYTHNGEPSDWKKDFLADVNSSYRVEYKDEIFYVEKGDYGICCMFHGGHVYSFDSYFADCEIFQQIIKENICWKYDYHH